jgi:hypothetical protein
MNSPVTPCYGNIRQRSLPKRWGNSLVFHGATCCREVGLQVSVFEFPPMDCACFPRWAFLAKMTGSEDVSSVFDQPQCTFIVPWIKLPFAFCKVRCCVIHGLEHPLQKSHRNVPYTADAAQFKLYVFQHIDHSFAKTQPSGVFIAKHSCECARDSFCSSYAKSSINECA